MKTQNNQWVLREFLPHSLNDILTEKTKALLIQELDEQSKGEWNFDIVRVFLLKHNIKWRTDEIT